MAKKTRAELTSQINTLLADNTNNEITAQDIRNMLGFLVESLMNLTDDDPGDISGFDDAVSANADVVAGNTVTSSNITALIQGDTHVSDSFNKRHTHTAGTSVADLSATTGTIDNQSGGTPADRVNTTGNTTTDNNNATMVTYINTTRQSVATIESKVNTMLARLRAFGIINT